MGLRADVRGYYMIRIAICDDDEDVIENVKQHLIGIDSELTDERLNISAYTSGEMFLSDIDLGLSFHIVFMDIEMDGINGVDVGKQLRERQDGDDTIMIYVSSHNRFFEELVQIGSFRFIQKPIDNNKLRDTFSRALNQAIKLNRATKTSVIFKYKSGSDYHSITTSKIVYMKSVRRTIEVVAQDSIENRLYVEGKFYSTVDEVLEQLPKDSFVRCGRSLVVNLYFVHHIEKDAFILSDNKSTRVPIGRKYKHESEVTYFQYLEGAL